MSFLESQLRITFTLGMYSILLSLCKCVPDKSRYEDFDLDWGRFTWPPFTFKPWKPSEENTLRLYNPYDSGDTYKHPDGTFILVVILVPMLLNAIAIGCICRYYICRNNECNSDSTSNSILHTPPRPPSTTASSIIGIADVHIPIFGNRRQPSQLLFTNLRADIFSASNAGLRRNEAPSGDKPPDYASVVTNESSGEKTRFPSVTLEKKEDLPPMYDEISYQKY